MAKNKSVIELNGRQYDTATGSILSGKKLIGRVKNKMPTNGSIMDGVMRPPKVNHQPAKEPRKARTYTRQVATTKAQDLHSKTQRSYTLVRDAAKKAMPSMPKMERPKARKAIIDPQRIERAKLISKNQHVNRFGLSSAPLPTNSVKIINEIANRAAEPISHAPAKTMAMARSAASQVPVITNRISSLPASKQLASIIDEALERADTHRQTIQRKAGFEKWWQKIVDAPRWLTVSLAGLLVILIAGFFAFQNIPTVAINVASKRAGFSAIHPTYTPAGFGYQKVNYGKKYVNLTYKANADGNRTYGITQQVSNWDSATLLTEYVTQGGQTYQTSQSTGKTIFIYGKNNNATWVDSGIWFVLENNAQLTSEQILKITDGL